MTHTRIIRLLILAGVLATAAYFLSQLGSTDKEYIAKVELARKQKDHSFRGSGSPLPEKERPGFTNLVYFPVDPKMKFRVKMEKLPSPEPVEIKLTGDRVQTYTRYAKTSFTLNGKSYALFLFQRPSGSGDNSFFVPFTDLSNGKTTYGGGRYLDVEPVAAGEVELDFNAAYSPYCAYNYEYSCPIPPKENHLPIEINAGEKAMPTH